MKFSKTLKQRKPAQSADCFPAHTPAVLKRIYLNRGIVHPDEIKTDLTDLLSFKGLLNIDKAAELLAAGIEQQKKFLIIGDFDADGATSTALGVKALKALGARYVSYLIPNRFEYGYGLTPEIVDAAARQKPDILITVDNGISSHEGVLRAKQYGMQVLITDHHLPAPTLPEADVIINPNQYHDNFESKNLAGVGVIFYVMLALRDFLSKNKNIHTPAVNMACYLDLVALGTVADVVILDKNNRILVHHGLKRIRKAFASPGILALLRMSKRRISQTSTSDLGFFAAPRLNAAGRLEDMSLGVACLLSENADEAGQLAEQLNALNIQRREIEGEMTCQAEKILQKHLGDFKENHIHPSGLCLYHPDFHQGVIGILAGRLKDYYHRPTVVFSRVSETELKGSARSISGCHLRDILALIHTRHPDIILKFGGHAMAAGLSIHEKNLDKFSAMFNQTVCEHLSPESLENILLTDGNLQPEEICVETAKLLQEHLVCGQGFAPPLFEGEFILVEQSLLQEKHLKLKLALKPDFSQTLYFDAIAFNYPALLSPETSRIYLAYRLDINEYRDNKNLQLMIEQIRLAD